MGELSTAFFPPRSHRIKGLEIKHFDGGFFSRRRWIAVAIHLTVRSGKSLGLVMFGVGTAIGMLAWQSFLSCAISKAFVLWSVLVSFFELHFAAGGCGLLEATVATCLHWVLEYCTGSGDAFGDYFKSMFASITLRVTLWFRFISYIDMRTN